jgi:hypothetical protein
MQKLSKNIYNELSSDGKALVIAQMKKSNLTKKTAKVRSSMANEIAKKVVSAMKRKTTTTRKYTKRKR